MTEPAGQPPQNEQPECPPDLLGQDGDASRDLILPTLDFSPDPEMAAGGWERRFMADPSRAEEAGDIYSELGFEVRTVAINPSELSDLCGDCRLATCSAYVTLYTRRSPPKR